jgi:hypothetical protein
MASLRDARAGALIRRHRDLADDFTRALPLLLDDLDAIDEAHGLDGIVKFEGELTEEQIAEFREKWESRHAPTDDQLAAWVERNPKAFADWAAKQARVSVGRTPPVPVSDKPPKAPPATRRRTTR